jgi:thioredoxin reductase
LTDQTGASSSYEVIIVGAGPAGLSAALILARCRRRIAVFDTGRPRNAASHGLHGFLSRDGIEPLELLRVAREQLEPYGVEVQRGEVVSAASVGGGFRVALDDGRAFASRRLLLATGVVDRVPEWEGAREMYGRSLFHCPYCDGWEVRDQPLAVYGPGREAFRLALSLTRWSPDVAYCTGPRVRLSDADRRRLTRHGISLRREEVVRLEGSDGVLERVVFASGEPLPRRALFFRTGQHQRSPLAEQLGCAFNRKGTVKTNRFEGTNVPGLYVAGDASEDVQLAIIAASEGVRAAFAINHGFMKEELA